MCFSKFHFPIGQPLPVQEMLRNFLLIIDKFPVEFSLLMPLLHLSLETKNRFIHLRHFFTILLSLSLSSFLSWILGSLLSFLVLKRILLKKNYFISFHFILFPDQEILCDLNWEGASRLRQSSELYAMHPSDNNKNTIYAPFLFGVPDAIL